MGKKKKVKTEIRSKLLSENTINKIFISLLVILPLIYFAQLLSGTKMMAGSDWLLAGYSSRNWLANCIKQYHQGPFWDPSVFCGLPAGNPYTFHTLLYLIIPAHLGWTYIFVFSTMFAGLGMYLYIKELKFQHPVSSIQYPAFIGALIYMNSGSVLSMASPGHDGKILACAFFPFILLTLHKGLTKHRLIYFLFAGGIAGIAAVNAHFQLIYYAGIVCIFYFIFHLVWQRKENKLKGTLKLTFYAFCALALMAGFWVMNYLPTLASLGWGARGGERGYGFATSWALPTSELLNLLTPHFSGILNNYWGENYFKLDTQYLGILPLILSLFAVVFYRREKYVKFFIGVVIIAILFALGGHTPFYHIPYWFLPGIKKFRAPAMDFYLVAFAMAVLTAYATTSLLHSKNKNTTQKLTMILLIAVFGIVFIFTVICSGAKESILSAFKSHWEPILFHNYGNQLAQQKLQALVENYPNFIGGLWKALILIAINSVFILLLVRNKIKLVVWTIIAGAVLIFDQWSIEKQFLKTVAHPKKYYKSDSVVNFLSSIQYQVSSIKYPEYRVFPLIYEHSTDGYLSIYNIQSVGGYVPNPGARYQKLIGAGESVMFNPANLLVYKNLLNILNIKYTVSVWLPEDLSKYPEDTKKMIDNFKLGFLRQWGISFEDLHKDFEVVYEEPQGRAIYENKGAMSRIWIVHNFEVLQKEQVLERMKQSDFDPRATVILEEQPRVQSPEFRVQSSEKVEIKEYSPNKIVLEAELGNSGFLVLSENWHPDWKVYVDGRKEKLFVADYVLRGIQLDKGTHNIKLIYEPSYFNLGMWLFLLSSLLLIGTIVFWVKYK